MKMPDNHSAPLDKERLDGLLNALAEAPNWPADRLKDELAWLVCQPVAKIENQEAGWRRLDELAETWATLPDAVRLFDAWADAVDNNRMDPMDRHVYWSACHSAQAQALRQDRLPLFQNLEQEKFGWNLSWRWAHLIDGAYHELPSPLVMAYIWATLSKDDRSELYTELGKPGEEGRDAGLGLQALLRLYASDPSPHPSSLSLGLAQVLPEISNDADQLDHTWAMIRPHVAATDMLASIVEHTETNRQAYREIDLSRLFDTVLKEVPSDLQRQWLAREDLTLPRTQAAYRQSMLAMRSASSRARPRLRS